MFTCLKKMVAINWLNETQEVNRDHAVVCLGLTLVFFLLLMISFTLQK